MGGTAGRFMKASSLAFDAARSAVLGSLGFFLDIRVGCFLSPSAAPEVSDCSDAVFVPLLAAASGFRGAPGGCEALLDD